MVSSRFLGLRALMVQTSSEGHLAFGRFLEGNLEVLLTGSVLPGIPEDLYL